MIMQNIGLKLYLSVMKAAGDASDADPQMINDIQQSSNPLHDGLTDRLID